MGTGTIATAEPTDQLEGFLSRVSSVQTSLIQAINSNEPLRAAFAEAEAKMILLEQITPEVSAYLLRFCDPKLDMVEVVNTADKDKQIRCVAMGILNGFVPGKEQFGIHTGKLYVKEAGYRKLFSKINGCGVPDVQVGHPDLVDLGNGKKVWKVDGVASVKHRDIEHAVECVRDFAIGIPSHGTDHIDGIKTKARRRLLQLLWKKVSSIGLEDSEEDFEGTGAGVVVVPTKQIENKGEPELTERERQALAFDQTYIAIQKRVKDPSHLLRINDAWEAIKAATDKETLRQMYSTISEWVKEIGKNNVDELHRWCQWRAAGIAE